MTLIGPMPPMPDKPKLPTPWHTVGNVIMAANGVEVAVISNSHLFADEDDEIASVIAEAVSRKFEPATCIEDPNPPNKLRAFVNENGGKAFEVEPGWVVFAPTRTLAEERFERFNSTTDTGKNTYGDTVDSALRQGYEAF